MGRPTQEIPRSLRVTRGLLTKDCVTCGTFEPAETMRMRLTPPQSELKVCSYMRIDVRTWRVCKSLMPNGSSAALQLLHSATIARAQ